MCDVVARPSNILNGYYSIHALSYAMDALLIPSFYRCVVIDPYTDPDVCLTNFLLKRHRVRSILYGNMP